MMNAADFVRLVSIPGDRYNVVIGHPRNEVVVDGPLWGASSASPS